MKLHVTWDEFDRLVEGGPANPIGTWQDRIRRVLGSKVAHTIFIRSKGRLSVELVPQDGIPARRITE